MIDFLQEKVCGVIAPPPWEETTEYQEANSFKTCIVELMESSEGANFGWVKDYALGEFERCRAAYDRLDDKADALVKYLGGGTGLFALGLLVNTNPRALAILAWALPSFLAALASILFATLARKPKPVAFPPDVKTAFHFAYQFKQPDAAQTAMIGILHLACEEMSLAGERKSRQVRYSSWLFCASLLLLTIPVLYVLIRAVA